MTWRKMKLKQLLEQLNQLAKERPEALEMESVVEYDDGFFAINDININIESVINDLEEINSVIVFNYS